MTRRDLILLVLLFLAACWANWDEAQRKPVESYPGQAYFDNTGWHLEE
jgi:hypothetical protein